MSGKEKVRKLISMLGVEGAIHFILEYWSYEESKTLLSVDHIFIDGYLCLSAVYALAKS